MLPVYSGRDLSSLFYAIYRFLNNSYQNIILRLFSMLYLVSETRISFGLLNTGGPKTDPMCNHESAKDCEHLPMAGARSSHGATSCLLETQSKLARTSINLRFTVEVKFNAFFCTDLQKNRPGRNSKRTSMSGCFSNTRLNEVYAWDLFLRRRLPKTVITQPAHTIYSSFWLPSLLEQLPSFLSWASLVAA